MEARRWTPSLLANVLFALKGGRRLLCLATEAAIGIADALSVLARAESVLRLEENSGKVSSEVRFSAGGDSGLGCCG